MRADKKELRGAWDRTQECRAGPQGQEREGHKQVRPEKPGSE